MQERQTQHTPGPWLFDKVVAQIMAEAEQRVIRECHQYKSGSLPVYGMVVKSKYGKKRGSIITRYWHSPTGQIGAD